MGNRLIIVSNRLPYRLGRGEDGGRELEHSSGGLVSGLGPLHERPGNVWVGWADEGGQEPSARERSEFDALLAAHDCVPVHVGEEDAHAYYDGFSNSALWPLFHGFPQYTRFEEADWEAYRRVNERFCDAVLSVARPGDTVWVHDYHLMLLPSLIRKASPRTAIGFFLHIPFPDYETFRMLPWRQELLLGTLSADLIGFHTYDYVRHFLSSCRRLLGYDNHLGHFLFEGRTTQVDAFPLGIDYDRFHGAALEPKAACQIERIRADRERPGSKTMLSVERLDYTKGIPERLRAFDAFLQRYPSWRENVVLKLVAVPSREGVASYQSLKREVDELVGSINGRYATSDWTPVEYYYRSVPFDLLAALYATSDVMLVTPLRDGMNLVCKEYLACRGDEGGALVLSEMAGATYELHEALVVNPFDRDAMVEAMLRALEMPLDEQRCRVGAMQKRLARYTAGKWAEEFLAALDGVLHHQARLNAHLLGPTSSKRLQEAFAQASKRLVLLDYDGTLVRSSTSRPTQRPTTGSRP